MFKLLATTLAIMVATWYLHASNIEHIEKDGLLMMALEAFTGIFLALTIFFTIFLIGMVIDSPESWATQYEESYSVDKIIYDDSSFYLDCNDGNEIEVKKKEMFVEKTEEQSLPMRCDKYTGFSELLYSDVTIYRLYKPEEVEISYKIKYKTSSQETDDERNRQENEST